MSIEYSYKKDIFQCRSCGTVVGSAFQKCPNCEIRESNENISAGIKDQNNELRRQTEKILERMDEIEQRRKIDARLERELSISSTHANHEGRNAAKLFDTASNAITLHENGSISCSIPGNPYLSDRLKDEFNNGFLRLLLEEITSQTGSLVALTMNIAYQWGKVGAGMYPDTCAKELTIEGKRKIRLRTNTFIPFLYVTLDDNKEKWNLFYKHLPFSDEAFKERYLDGLKDTLRSGEPEAQALKKTFIEKSNAYLANKARVKNSNETIDAWKFIGIPIAMLIPTYFIHSNIHIQKFLEYPIGSFILVWTLLQNTVVKIVYGFLDSLKEENPADH